ncbi:MAG: flagellin [bacterium]
MSVTRIYTNPEAMLARRNLGVLEDQISTTIRHLSTGLRITRGADDPSGLAIAGKFEAQMRGATTAIQNAEDALSMLTLADDTVNTMMELLQRARDLAVRSSSEATMTTAQRTALENELWDIGAEVNRQAQAVTFNEREILNGGLSQAVVQVGADNDANQRITMSVPRISWGDLNGVDLSGIAVSTATAAQSAIDFLDSAINAVATLQSAIGVQERNLQYVIEDLSSAEYNMAAAKSRILDADMAQEIADLARLTIITQTGVAALAQANMQPQAVLTLLGTVT